MRVSNGAAGHGQDKDISPFQLGLSRCSQSGLNNDRLHSATDGLSDTPGWSLISSFPLVP